MYPEQVPERPSSSSNMTSFGVIETGLPTKAGKRQFVSMTRGIVMMQFFSAFLLLTLRHGQGDRGTRSNFHSITREEHPCGTS